MASIHVTNVVLMKNPANYTEDFSFHVRFDAIEELRSYYVLLPRQCQRILRDCILWQGLACSQAGQEGGHWPPSQASTAPVTNRPVLEGVADGGSAWFGIVLLLPEGYPLFVYIYRGKVGYANTWSGCCASIHLRSARGFRPSSPLSWK